MAVNSGKPAIKTQQGANSSTWTAPPFYGPLTVPELFAFHAEHSAEHPVFAYDDEQGAVQTIQHKDVFRGIRKAAGIVSEHLRVDSISAIDRASGGTTVVGILAVADSITYLTLIVGIMYLGHTPFPISARNSPVAVAHLVRRTGVRQLLVSRDAAMQRVALEAKRELAEEGYDVALLPLPAFAHFYNDAEVPEDVRMGGVDPDKTCLFLHSSGSTSFPKPIPLLHRNFTKWLWQHYFADRDLCGCRVSMHVLPIFHVMGIFSIPWILGSGMVMTVFRPSAPPTIATPDTVMDALIQTPCHGLVCVPTFLEAWGRHPQHVDALRSLGFIMYAGAPLSRKTGTFLVENGINITTGFGLTETGAFVKHLSDRTKALPPSDWEYFTISDPVEYARRYQDGQPGIFELVILDSPWWSPHVFNTEVDGRPAYATSDLLIEHPTDPTYFKVFGRADDQIILSTGEKTNPIPMEAILLQDPNIFAAIVFGRGRFQNGVIIQPSESFDPTDEAQLEAFRQKIWPTVERANNFAPSHSRIFKEMITVTKPDKPFQYTAKGTTRRHVCLAEYAEEIDALYKKVEESSQVDAAPPPTWNEENVLVYVRTVVQRIMTVQIIQDEDDLFQQGCDSLQATWIRNTILHALRTTTKLSVHEVPLNFVYTHPTITALSTFLHRVLSGGGTDKEAERTARIAQMTALLHKYGAGFPKPAWITRGASASSSQENILITGTTGRLGSHLLAQLLQKPEVVRVYALNRDPGGGSGKLAGKQREAFRAWGLDEAMLLNGKISFHAADLGKLHFGLGEEEFQQMRNSVTGIIHNAWRVDFQVSLSSFEPLITGARDLLDFALGSPISGGPRVLFVSSISSVLNYASTTEAVPESLDLGPEVAVGLGYGESKWVTERVFARAARETGLRVTAVRVGQLSGDARVGGWSAKEWVPALVRASTKLGAVPKRDDTVSWVPIDTAAASLLEMLYSGEQILHLTAPRPVAWNDIFGPIAERLGVPLVPPDEWLTRLRESARKAEAGPRADAHDSAHTLIDFFEGTMSARDVPFSTDKSVLAARSLAELAPLGKEDALRWLSFWASIGFLKL